MDDSARKRVTGESLPPGASPLWTPEDLDREWRIRQWEAAGAPVPRGAPDPLDRCYGTRNATPDQLEGEQLTVKELPKALNMSIRAVTNLTSKSYRLIESDLWDDLVRVVFEDLRDLQADLVEDQARYKAITLTLNDQCAATSAGKGWVEPKSTARDGRLSFLWERVLLRGFPTHGRDLLPPRDCPLLRDSADPELAFAIVKHGGRGRGNAWLFKRARVPEQVWEWRKPPDFVMGYAAH